MNDALYKVTGQVMHAAHLLYLSVTQFHQAVCENKGARTLKERYARILPAEDGLAAALAVWKTDVAASISGDLPKATLPQKERPPFAYVDTIAGHAVLFVADILVANEGHPCHDPDIVLEKHAPNWTAETLALAAHRINEAREAYG